MPTRKAQNLIDESIRTAAGDRPPPASFGKEAAAAMGKAAAGTPEIVLYQERFKDLKRRRRRIEPLWLQMRQYLLPETGRMIDADDPDADDERVEVDVSHIFDSTPARAVATAASGLHGGLTSPSVQWFSFYVGEYKNFRERAASAAKDWVYNAQVCVRDVLAASNFYSAIQKFYLEELGYLTACMMITQDDRTVARFQALDIGSYWLGHGDDRRPNVLYRRLSSTARDIVSRYGRANTPKRVIEAVERRQGDRRFYVIQAIQPWNHFGALPGRRRQWEYEDVRFVEGSGEEDPILFRGGYATQPFVAVRWGDSGDSTYGRGGPGLSQLSDNKQLQTITLAANIALEWKIQPPWLVPPELKEKLGNGIVPGQIIPYSGDPRNAGIVPLVPAEAFNFQHVLLKCQDLRELVRDSFFNPYFTLIQSRNRQMTATEVMQLIQEKSDLLGPVVTQNMSEGLTPMLERTYGLSEAAGLLPPAPAEIAGEELRPYFTSSLAIAQRQASLSGMNVFAAWYVQQIQLGNVEVKDVIDTDAWLRELAETEQVPASILRGEDEVEEIRADRARQAQEARRAESLRAGAQAAHNLGGASVGPDSLLGKMLGTEAEAP
jgi:hypothetical protein